jgi:hypothetical protein
MRIPLYVGCVREKSLEPCRYLKPFGAAAVRQRGWHALVKMFEHFATIRRPDHTCELQSPHEAFGIISTAVAAALKLSSRCESVDVLIDAEHLAEESHLIRCVPRLVLLLAPIRQSEHALKPIWKSLVVVPNDVFDAGIAENEIRLAILLVIVAPEVPSLVHLDTVIP